MLGPGSRRAPRGSFFSLFPSVVSTEGAAAQIPRDLTPDESVRIGLENNPTRRAAGADTSNEVAEGVRVTPDGG